MKTKNLLLFSAMFAVACNTLEPYTIDSPEDLMDKIAEYESEKGARNHGDTLVIDLSPIMIGAEDNSTAWWGDWSQSFELAQGRLLHLEFDNYGAKSRRFDNWNVCVATTPGHSADDNANYKECFVVTADDRGWGGAAGVFDASQLHLEYNGEPIESSDEAWFTSTFLDKMYGARVSLELDYSALGIVFLTAKSVALDGSEILLTYNQATDGTTPLYAFLTTDLSHFEMKKAYTINSKVKEVEDFQPETILVSGLPAAVNQGTKVEEIAALPGISATATFQDGSSKEVKVSDVIFSASSTFATVPGTDVIVYTYAKTKNGAAASKPAAGYSMVEVRTSLTKIEAVAKAYVIGSASHVTLSPSAISVTGTYAGGVTAAIPVSDCTVSFTSDKIVYDAVAGTYPNAFTVTYGSGEDALSVKGSLVIAKSSQNVFSGTVGSTDNTTGFHAMSSPRWSVAAGESQTVQFRIGGTAAQENWHCPLIFLYNSSNAELAFVRLDNWGTGSGYVAGTTVPTSNWNWDIFRSSMAGSKVSLTVANDGFSGASIRMQVDYANNESHYQYFDVVKTPGGAVSFEVSVELCHLIFGE